MSTFESPKGGRLKEVGLYFQTGRSLVVVQVPVHISGLKKNTKYYVKTQESLL